MKKTPVDWKDWLMVLFFLFGCIAFAIVIVSLVICAVGGAV